MWSTVFTLLAALIQDVKQDFVTLRLFFFLHFQVQYFFLLSIAFYTFVVVEPDDDGVLFSDQQNDQLRLIVIRFLFFSLYCVCMYRVD